MLSNALIIALIVVLIHTIFKPGMVLGKLGKAMYGLPTMLKKPLFHCVVCMTPWYGSLIYLLLYNWTSFVQYLATIIVAAGINAIIDKYINHEY
jgi:hypothetical protein